MNTRSMAPITSAAFDSLLYSLPAKGDVCLQEKFLGAMCSHIYFESAGFSVADFNCVLDKS